MPWFILFTLCFATFNANSKTQEHPIEQLLKIEIAAYQLSSAFSAYVLFTGSPQFSQKLEQTIEKTSPIISREKASHPRIINKLQASLDFIQRKKELVYSPDDHRLIIGFQTFQNPLYQMINDKKHAILQQEPSPAALSDNISEYFHTRISFERVLAQYTALSASSAGFVVSDITIEENVDAFSSNIENITKKGSDYQRLKVKWRFIKSNMLKNPGETSPFITMRTAIDIRKLLKNIYKSAVVKTAISSI